MSAERLKIDKEKELLEREKTDFELKLQRSFENEMHKIQDEKTDFELKLQRSFNENEMQRMKYLYELKLREVKVRIITFIFAYCTSR